MAIPGVMEMAKKIGLNFLDDVTIYILSIK